MTAEQDSPNFDIDAERASIDRRVASGALSTAEGQALTERAWHHYEALKAAERQAREAQA